MNESKNWYIVYTRRGQEKKVAEILNRKKIETYCPFNYNIPQTGYLRRSLHEALFCCFCFVRISNEQIPELRKTNGVINIVFWLNKPVIVPDHEISLMKQFLYEYKLVKVEKVDIQRKSKSPANLVVANNDNRFYQTNTTKVMLPSLGYVMIAKPEKVLDETLEHTLFPRLRSIMDKIVG